MYLADLTPLLFLHSELLKKGDVFDCCIVAYRCVDGYSFVWSSKVALLILLRLLNCTFYYLTILLTAV